MTTTLINTGLGKPDVVRETEKAILVELPNGVTGFHNRYMWVPKSQVQWIAVGCFHPTMHVPAWLSRKIK